MASAAYGEHPTWTPARPHYRPTRVVLSWLVSALALLLASYLVPHVTVDGLGGAIVASALIALLNALLPPIVAALRLPYTLIAGFLLVLVLDALMLRITSEISDGRAISVDSFWWALLTALDRLGRDDRPRGDLRDERRRHVHDPGDPADRAAIGRRERRPTLPGSSSSRSTGSRCRCCGARCATATRP